MEIQDKEVTKAAFNFQIHLSKQLDKEFGLFTEIFDKIHKTNNNQFYLYLNDTELVVYTINSELDSVIVCEINKSFFNSYINSNLIYSFNNEVFVKILDRLNGKIFLAKGIIRVK